jgi:hypothetical protein
MSTCIISVPLQSKGDSDTLTLVEILADIPHDPTAFLVYAMLVASGWLIWKGSRQRKPPQG